jgi:hypothetical protein
MGLPRVSRSSIGRFAQGLNQAAGLKRPAGWLPREHRRSELQLSFLAYNLGNLWRLLVWHAPYYRLLLAEGHLTDRAFAAILLPISAPPLPVNSWASEAERHRALFMVLASKHWSQGR